MATLMGKFVRKVTNSCRKIGRVLSDNSIDFCQNTVIPGFKYIGDRSISLWERSFFLVSFLATLLFVITLTTNIYTKWVTTPVIVGMSPHPILISKMPFPTVTICNVNQASASQVRNFSRNSVEYSMLQTLCSRSVDNVNPSKLAHFKNRSVFQKFIKENAQSCDKLFVSCKYGSIMRNCTDLIKPVLTDDGQCCVFNSVHTSFIYRQQKPLRDIIRNDGATGADWNPEDGYRMPLPKSFYPRVAFGTGISKGFSIVLDAQLEDYYCSSTNGPGFKLLLHNPIETPLIRENGLFIEAGSEMTFRIRADRSEASPNIRSFSIDDRQCVFNSDRQLRNFKTYTRHNCEMECLANMTAKLCGCISYYLPDTLPSMPVCNLKDLKCQQPVRLGTTQSTLRKNRKSCRELCMQGCFDLSFTPSRFTIPLTSGGYMIQNQMLQEYNISYIQKNIAVVHFYYKLSSFDGFMRTRYVGATEFLSNTGGLLGLLGLSFVSMAEVVYFLGVRPLRQLGIWISSFFAKRKN